ALDAAAAGAQSARAQARAAAAQLDLLLAGTRPEEIQAARQQAEQAREAVRLARAQRENAFVYAPLDGIVKTKIVEAGETVTAGTPLAVVLDMRRPWLRVFIPETRYGQVRIGDRAEVTVDSFPGDVFVGAVSEIASEAEFTPKNVQSQEERVKLVFGVKIDLRGSDGRLKPGMPADAVIRTAAKRRLTAQSP
ncbi:MAG: efflux RND transporter periplasmic adaptor subunit, partial [Chthonomonadales bacterium]|nr:efflux RND transporter periplasmic adaptor subunit [Chthonomonadales bacterium]